MKIYKRRLQRPHSPKKHEMKEEITSQKKNYLKSKKKVTAKDKRPLLLFCFTEN